MSAPIKPDNATFRANTKIALQEAAGLFKQNKVNEAYHVLDENIFKPSLQLDANNPLKDKVRVIYRSIIPDPLTAPETSYSKRNSGAGLKGAALRDLVKHFSAASNPDKLSDGVEKTAILKAAELLEKTGDEAGAWKLLHDALPESFKPENYRNISEFVMKEVYRIMMDSLRTPTSPFLKWYVEENPEALDPNRLRARALDALAYRLFEAENRAPVLQLPHRVLAQNILLYPNGREVASFGRTSHKSAEVAKDSLRLRKEATIEEVKAWIASGITLEEGSLASLRILRGNVQSREDLRVLRQVISICPNLTEISIDAERFTGDINPTLGSIGTICNNLTHFALRNYRYGITIEPLVQGCKNLQHLDLHRSELNDASKLSSIAECCSNLISIDVVPTNERDLCFLLEKNKALTSVKIHNSGALTDATLTSLAKCSHLQCLAICTRETFPQVVRFSAAGMKTLAYSCRKISHLEFRNFNVAVGTLTEIGNSRLPLRSICIENSWDINANDIGALAEKCPLENVQLIKCRLGNDCMEALRSCQTMTTLDVSQNGNIDVDGMQFIADNCPNLTRLTLAPGRPKGIMQALADGVCRLTQFEMLRGEKDLTSDEIIAFVKKNPGLTHLNLNSSRNVNDDVLIAISQLLPKLESIDISHSSVTPKGIAALGKGCPLIKNLRATFLWESTFRDDLLYAIAENFPALTHLDLSGNREYNPHFGTYKGNFSATGLAALGKGCPNIVNLDLSSNELYNWQLNAVAESFFKLQVFRSFGNLAFSDECRTKLQKNSPGVIIT